MNSSVIIRTALPTDAPQIAELIMVAMTLECCAYFYGEQHTADDFKNFLTQLARQSDTQYSYRNTLLAELNGTIVGIAVSYDGSKLHQLRTPFIKGMLRTFNKDFSGMRDETQGGELYLDSLAVVPTHRHQGIASRLLQATAHKAKSLNLPNVGLLVDDNNPNALRLYQANGFELKDFSEWGGHAMKHLQLPVV